jgi:hypothetical protein
VFSAEQAQRCWEQGRHYILIRAATSQQDMDALRVSGWLAESLLLQS